MAKIDSDLLFKLECDSRELQCIALDLDDIGIWRGDRFGGDFRTSACVRHLVDAVRRAGFEFAVAGPQNVTTETHFDDTMPEVRLYEVQARDVFGVATHRMLVPDCADYVQAVAAMRGEPATDPAEPGTPRGE